MEKERKTPLKCAQCGEPVNLSKALDGVYHCPYCDFETPVPVKETPAGPLLEHAEALLSEARFDEAMEIYNQAAKADPKDPRPRFGKALCRFKVKYVRDYTARGKDGKIDPNGVLRPICYSPETLSGGSFLEDADYLAALTLSTPAQKALFSARGAGIEEVRSAFAALKAKGEKYDTFICVKVSDESVASSDGHKRKTEDAECAYAIHHFLSKKGYSPFFSEIDCHDRLGEQYEALILYALLTAPSLLLVVSDESYLNTPWVKNEYTRFLGMIDDGLKNPDSLTIVFNGRPIEKVPGRKGKIQGIDYSRHIGVESAILSFVEKHRSAKGPEPEDKTGLSDDEIASLKEKGFVIRRGTLVSYTGTESRVALPEGLSRIARGAFRKSRMVMEIVIPLDYEEIEDGAFDGLPYLHDIYCASSSKPSGWADGYLGSSRPAVTFGYVEAGDDFEIEDGVLITYRGSDKRVMIPPSVKTIGAEAFKGLADVESVVIPMGVEAIEESAFAGCQSLKDIYLPDSVSKLDSYAFDSCKNLLKVRLSRGLTSVSSGLFSGCSSLKTVILPDTVEAIEDLAFKGCDSLRTLNIPSGLKKVGKEALPAFLDRFTIRSNNNGFKVIDGNLYSNGGKTFLRYAGGVREDSDFFTDVDVDEIAPFAFAWSHVASIILPESVRAIGAYAFYKTDIESLTIPSNVKRVGAYIFDECPRLTEVESLAPKPRSFDTDGDGWHPLWSRSVKPVRIIWTASGEEEMSSGLSATPAPEAAPQAPSISTTPSEDISDDLDLSGIDDVFASSSPAAPVSSSDSADSSSSDLDGLDFDSLFLPPEGSHEPSPSPSPSDHRAPSDLDDLGDLDDILSPSSGSYGETSSPSYGRDRAPSDLDDLDDLSGSLDDAIDDVLDGLDDLSGALDDFFS